MLEWLIVGGGIHGTFFSNLLTAEAGIDPDDLRVIDPHSAPLAVWSRNAANCGMSYLRSPATHNIDTEILSVYRFAKSAQGRSYADFIPPYFRPSLKLFQQHCHHVIQERGLDRLRIQARAVALQDLRGAVGVETSSGILKARRVLIAIGLTEQLDWPAWGRKLRQAGGPVYHLFEEGFDRRRLTDRSHTIIVGSGASAVQLALKLSEKFEGRITLLARQPLRESPYDFDPCWIGPKCLKHFYRTAFGRRRTVVDRARFPGTVPSESMRALEEALQQGRLRLLTARVKRAVLENSQVHLELDGGKAWADQIILATGFLTHRPGGAFVKQLIREFKLKCADCGYPVIGEDLRWSERIFVAGPLAELQVGPCARNIIGARNAGRALLKYLQI